jgi:hypothetical protein
MSKTTAILIVLAILLVAQNAYGYSKRLVRRVRARKRARVAVEGEVEAESLVEKLGYTIEGRQVATTWTIQVDGEPVDISLRADLILERAGQRFVADVKTGKAAPRVETAATRRQLLEYLHAYPVDGVLLIDMTSKRVSEVGFGAVERKVRRPFGHLLAAFVAGAATGLLVLQLV